MHKNAVTRDLLARRPYWHGHLTPIGSFPLN